MVIDYNFQNRETALVFWWPTNWNSYYLSTHTLPLALTQ